MSKKPTLKKKKPNDKYNNRDLAKWCEKNTKSENPHQLSRKGSLSHHAYTITNIIGLSTLTAFTLTLYITWWTAFTNGGQTLITINEYKEMIPELIIFNLICLPTILIYLKHSLNNLTKRGDHKCQSTQ